MPNSRVRRPRHSKTDDGLYSHSFSTPPFPTRVTTPSIPSWSNIQTTRSTTTAGHGHTIRLLQPRQCHPCTPQTCQPGQNPLLPSRRADRQCDDTARGEATLELAPLSDRSLTTAQAAAMTYAILPPSLLTRDYALDQMALTFAANATSASRSSAGEPWKIDAP
jgi:hypothetical protein